MKPAASHGSGNRPADKDKAPVRLTPNQKRALRRAKAARIEAARAAGIITTFHVTTPHAVLFTDDSVVEVMAEDIARRHG